MAINSDPNSKFHKLVRFRGTNADPINSRKAIQLYHVRNPVNSHESNPVHPFSVPINLHESDPIYPFGIPTNSHKSGPIIHAKQSEIYSISIPIPNCIRFI